MNNSKGDGDTNSCAFVAAVATDETAVVVQGFVDFEETNDIENNIFAELRVGAVVMSDGDDDNDDGGGGGVDDNDDKNKRPRDKSLHMFNHRKALLYSSCLDF